LANIIIDAISDSNEVEEEHMQMVTRILLISDQDVKTRCFDLLMIPTSLPVVKSNSSTLFTHIHNILNPNDKLSTVILKFMLKYSYLFDTDDIGQYISRNVITFYYHRGTSSEVKVLCFKSFVLGIKLKHQALILNLIVYLFDGIVRRVDFTEESECMMFLKYLDALIHTEEPICYELMYLKGSDI
jgi:hypothetical protein